MVEVPRERADQITPDESQPVIGSVMKELVTLNQGAKDQTPVTLSRTPWSNPRKDVAHVPDVGQRRGVWGQTE